MLAKFCCTRTSSYGKILLYNIHCCYADKGCIHWCGSYVHFAATLTLTPIRYFIHPHGKNALQLIVSPTVLFVNAQNI